MILTAIVFWPLAGGLLAWLAGRWNRRWPRWVAAGTMAVHLLAVVAVWAWSAPQAGQDPWLLETNVPWIPQLGISFHLALDGLSLVLVLLTGLLGLLAVLASWPQVEERPGFFYLNLLWILAAILGAFLALDLFLFYLFWELMLVPLYFLIGIWGYERRVYATLKFVLFTQAGSLLMLVAILGLAILHAQASGTLTFDYRELTGAALPPGAAPWLMLGFFAAFAVKLPAVPLHTWLPDAHTEAPTAGSVVLAGLVLKVGAYGFLRFLIPLFPGPARDFAPLAMVLGVVGILYGGLLALGQRDLKRLVAYTSVSHMGFVLLGVFAWNTLALQGALVIILAHGISTGALFILVGDLYRRTGTRDLDRLGGLWSTVPRLSGLGLLFALAALGLPGLGNFVGEFLVLAGVWNVSVPLAVLATLGFVVSTLYSLRLAQRTFFGPNDGGWNLPDLNARELAIMAVLVAIIVWLGVFPQPILDTAAPALDAMQQLTAPEWPPAAGLEPAQASTGLLARDHSPALLPAADCDPRGAWGCVCLPAAAGLEPAQASTGLLARDHSPALLPAADCDPRGAWGGVCLPAAAGLEPAQASTSLLARDHSPALLPAADCDPRGAWGTACLPAADCNPRGAWEAVCRRAAGAAGGRP